MATTVTACGGGDDNSTGSAGSGQQVLQEQAISAESSRLAEALIRSRSWYQDEMTGNGTPRTDAIYRFKQDGAIRTGTRESIDAGGSSASAASPLLTSFEWRLDGDVLLLDTRNAAGSVIGSEAIGLVYSATSDEMLVLHDEFGERLWHGCGSGRLAPQDC